MSERPMGTIVVNEIICTIVHIELFDGKIWFFAQAEGPVPDYPGGETEMQFIGTDGRSIGSLRLDMPPLHDVTGHLRIEQAISLSEMTPAGTPDA